MIETLRQHAARLADTPLKTLAFDRASSAPLCAADWQVNTLRQHIDASAHGALLACAEAIDLRAAIDALFSAQIVNPSENSPALHWAFRAPGPLSGKAQRVRASLDAPLHFAEEVRAGTPAFRAIIHIGIGGSDFGPRLIADAFSELGHKDIDLRFAANVDPLELERALSGLDPATTLIIGVSKSFGTEETLYNLGRARRWLEASLGSAWPANLALITANPERARKWLGSESGRIFDMPLSVGGRFSLWSAASLACMIWLGPDTFQTILAGAAEMDAHVREAPLEQNMAAQLAMLDYWNASILGQPMRALLAYAHRLRMLPTYLQQLEMESNGKSVSPDGTHVETLTAPALWGGEGSVGQHSYHQWLHQGTHPIPTEFIVAPDANAERDGRHALIAHALAQAEVLCNGRSLEEVKAEEPGLDDATARQKVLAGGRASVFITHPNFGPHAFGALLALYEHRTYLAGKLWGLNSFDQWGVERGKTLAGRLKPALLGKSAPKDAVTAALLSQLGEL